MPPEIVVPELVAGTLRVPSAAFQHLKNVLPAAAAHGVCQLRFRRRPHRLHRPSPEPRLLPPCIRIPQPGQRMTRAGENEQIVPDGICPPVPLDEKPLFPLLPVPLHGAITEAPAVELALLLIDH